MPRYGRHGHGRRRGGMLEWLVEKAIWLIGIVIIFYFLYIVLSNGDYWGGKLGDMVSGLIDLIQSFVTHATS